MVTETRKETMSRYNNENKVKILFQSAEYRDQLRLEMVEAYGGCCGYCGIDDPIVLTLDHIFDDPAPEYEWCGKSSRGGYNLYRKLRQEGWPKGRFQLLCFNCNMRKEHKRRRDKMIEDMGPPPKREELSRGEARAKSGPSSNNDSGFKGVLWDKYRERWRVGTVIDGKFVFFGRFKDIRDAAKEYRRRMIEIWGNNFAAMTDEEIERKAEELGYGKVLSPRSSEELDF